MRELWEPEGLPQPLQRGRVLTNDQIYMDYAGVGSVQIGGPYRVDRHRPNDTPSRRAIFVCQPTVGADERACATRILSRMARLAYRRPVTQGRHRRRCSSSSQTAGARAAASTPASSSRSSACWSIRISCCACTAIRRRRAGDSQRRVYRMSDIELASRLSFFLWSSIPDERLLDLAERGELSKPAVLEQQVRRMLADPRATARSSTTSPRSG